MDGFRVRKTPIGNFLELLHLLCMLSVFWYTEQGMLMRHEAEQLVPPQLF